MLITAWSSREGKTIAKMRKGCRDHQVALHMRTDVGSSHRMWIPSLILSAKMHPECFLCHVGEAEGALWTTSHMLLPGAAWPHSDV